MAEVVAFYSYKGGVGRSIALANAAAVLARRGQRVVCIDFDIEAGGLHTIFGVPVTEIKTTVLDLLLNGGDPGRALIDLTQKLPAPATGGRLWLLTAVSQVEQLGDINEKGYETIQAMLTKIVTQIEDAHNPNFVLIDCRTGLAGFASAGLRAAEHFVCVLRPNRQNVRGMQAYLETLRLQKKRRLVVVSQIPVTRETPKRLRELESDLEEPFDVEIPYSPEAALDEAVIAVTTPSSPLLGVYERIADWLVAGAR